MILTFITADPKVGMIAEKAGVDRVMVDLEILGKEERQGHLDTVISRHSLADVGAMRGVLQRSELLVRINPIHAGSRAEIDDVIAAGAQRLMLPMFRHPDEVRLFLEYVAGRVPTVLLLETSAAFARLPQILAISDVEEVHIGLNDLHLDMQLDFMFEVFSGRLVDHASRLIKGSGKRFGIGGIARIGHGILPAEMVLSEHVRLGSQAVILSRDFGNALDDAGDFGVEVRRVREHVDALATQDEETREATRLAATKIIGDIALQLRAKRCAVPDPKMSGQK